MHLFLNAFAPGLMDIRTRLPMQALDQQPGITAVCQAPPTDLPNLPLDTPKIYIAQRAVPKHAGVWRKQVLKLIERGWLIVVETDDHPHTISQVIGQQHEARIWTTIRWCHAVQTSTDELRAHFLPYNPEVEVFPNAVFDLPALEPKQEEIIFYGAINRGTFPVRVAASLAAAIRAFPKTKFIIIGDRGVFDAVPSEHKAYYDYLPYGSYLALLRHCTISLAPLEGRPFEDCKSDAKFLDAARGGVLTVASPTVYARTIKHGETGLIASALEEWPSLLMQALGDSNTSRAIARRAWHYVRDERMFSHQVHARLAWYSRLWERRAQLNQKLRERMMKADTTTSGAAWLELGQSWAAPGVRPR